MASIGTVNFRFLTKTYYLEKEIITALVLFEFPDSPDVTRELSGVKMKDKLYYSDGTPVKIGDIILFEGNQYRVVGISNQLKYRLPIDIIKIRTI